MLWYSIIDDHPIQGAVLKALDMDKVQKFFKDVYDIDLAESDDVERKSILINSCLIAGADTNLFEPPSFCPQKKKPS